MKRYTEAHVSHAPLPAVVSTDGKQQVTAVTIEDTLEVLGTLADVEFLEGIVNLMALSRVQIMRLTGSLQFPPGAPPHLSCVNCIKPCSPAPPTVLALHELSCRRCQTATVVLSHSTYLHGESSQHDGRDTVLVAVLLEHRRERGARREGSVRRLDRRREILGDYVVNGDEGRIPAAVVDAAVQPVDVAVGSARRGDFLCRLRLAEAL